jgi:hypothetical protein
MAVPDFLSSAFRFTTLAAVTDVNTIIAGLNTELVTNGTWTDTGGTGVGPFKSEVGVDGTFFTLTVARLSATEIQYTVNDWTGILVYNPRQVIDAGGVNVIIASGPDYVYVESGTATPTAFMCCRLRDWPETPGNVNPNFVCTTGPLTAAGGATNRYWNLWYSCPAQTRTYGANGFIINRDPYGVTTHLISPSGALIFTPFDFADDSDFYLGRVPQVVILDSGLAWGAEYTLTIDSGVTAVFQVCTFVSLSSRRIAIRKA